ncbi:WD40/YVTN/BNR-like repeat-containing protein [Dactylosporangium sp. CS-033363]|uniref:WD40/YVTN/BNR-like repeat-containing protein n=1 Tax=Dactylosporangium sp. CS-033363 TaxID=3239935 RepID=UPI003D8C20C4
MTSLRERFDDAAAAAPPSRLSGPELYAAAWRRRRTRQRWAVAGAGVATALLALLVPVSRHPAPSLETPAPPAAITEAVQTDADHVYVLRRPLECDPMPKGGCAGRLLGSDDGGRTWTERSTAALTSLTSPTPGVLRAAFDDDLMRFSTDGGRTWKGEQRTDDAVNWLPPGGWMICLPSPRGGCELYGVDPGYGLVKRMATGPWITTVQGLLPAPPDAGIWVWGTQPDGHLGISASRDKGMSWRNGSLPGVEAATARVAGLATVDGQTAYAVVVDHDQRVLVYRTADIGKTWAPVDPGHTVPYRDHGQDAYLAADGTLVVRTVSNDPAQWFAGQGGGFAPGPVTGLPKLEGYRPIVPAGPGMYLTSDRLALYKSADGLRWTRQPVPLPAR